MNIKSQAIVKIISNSVKLDWFKPYRNKDVFNGVGTGFFIDSKGYIITCAHVIIDSMRTYITIPLLGRKKVPVDIISICPKYDIALLKVRDKYLRFLQNIEYLELIDSNKMNDKIKQNESVVAIGYPAAGQEYGGEKLMYTSGTISGINNILIQTDTPINPGNSGGPLIKDNKVIGINSSKIGSEIVDNVGYSIPIYYFKLIEKEMRNGKKIIDVPELMCNFQNTDAYLIEYYRNNIGCKQGYLVKNIIEESPLYKINIRSGDFLCGLIINNQEFPIDNFGDIQIPWSIEKMNINNVIKRFTYGEEFGIKFWKPYQNIQTQMISLIENNLYKIRYHYPIFEKIDYEIIGGIVFMNMTMNHFEYWNQKMEQGVKSKLSSISNRMNNMLLISDILDGSYIHGIHILNVGDILNEIETIKITSLEELRKSFLIIMKNYVMNPNRGRYIKITTKSKAQIVLDLEYIIKENEYLASKHKYNLSALHYSIKEIIIKTKQNKL